MHYKNNDLQPILHEYLFIVKDEGFEWGKWDCCRFVNSFIELVTGCSAIPNGIKWSNEKSALEAISKLGKNFPETISNVFKNLNYRTINSAFLQAGDIVLIKEQDFALGIYDGMDIRCVSDDGLTIKPINLFIKAWRING